MQTISRRLPGELARKLRIADRAARAARGSRADIVDARRRSELSVIFGSFRLTNEDLRAIREELATSDGLRLKRYRERTLRRDLFAPFDASKAVSGWLA